MAEIIPFRGWRYNNATVRNINLAVVPPYDVISAQDQKKFLKQHPYNLVRLILSETKAKPNDKVSPYEDMAKTLGQWQELGILCQDALPAFYIYSQTYTLEGKTKTRVGLLTLLKLEPLGEKHIFPHEITFSKPKEDRLNFLRHFKSNLEPIFGLYQDPRGTLDRLLRKYTRLKPVMRVEHPKGLTHKLWPVSELGDQKKIKDFIGPRHLLIADGHHRYGAGLMYSQELAHQCRGTALASASQYILAFITNGLDKKGLTILPYNRVIKHLSPSKLRTVKKVLAGYFDLKEVQWSGLPEKGALSLIQQLGQVKKGVPGFAFYQGGPTWSLLTLKKKFLNKKIVDPKQSLAWNHLTTALADKIVIEKTLHIPSDQKQLYIKFTPHTAEAIRMVRAKEASACLLFYPADVPMIADLAKRGEKMPQKSTYFYPKVYNGLVLRTME